jgi:hypothetical protein
MSSDDVLGRIMNHKMNIQEANNIKNLYKGILTSEKQDISLKANKSKKKKVLIESPSEEEEEEEEDNEREYDEDKVALFIKKFNKFIKKRSLTREKGNISQGQRGCATIIARMGISLPNDHMRGMKKIMTRERSLTKATRKIRNILRRSLMVKHMLAKNGTQVMRVPNRKATNWQP